MTEDLSQMARSVSSPEALRMQRGQNARHGDRKDAQHAVPPRAHNQQHHNGNVRPWRASCTGSNTLLEPQVLIDAELRLA